MARNGLRDDTSNKQKDKSTPDERKRTANELIFITRVSQLSTEADNEE